MGLDSVELVMTFEDTFGVDLIDDEAIERAATPRMVGDLIFSKLKERSKGAWTREGVSIAIKEIVTRNFGIDQSVYTEDSRYVEDFGMN